MCFPEPSGSGERRHACRGLYDVSLALLLKEQVVGNDLAADGKGLVVITGANQGGKSTFLRSVGQAQLMMQSGMFVAAEAFRANVCDGLYTHYRREEDASMVSGKLDEELARMSEIVDQMTPNSVVLLNESFAATNEREGSEIARQIVCALVEAGVKVFFVTHLYVFAHRPVRAGDGQTRCSCGRSAQPAGRGRSRSRQASRWRRAMGRICTARFSVPVRRVLPASRRSQKGFQNSACYGRAFAAIVC